MSAMERVQLRITNPEPRVWFERLVIFRNTDPLDVIRDVPLHRGVNIVWAKEDESDDPGPAEVHGHSAGKTSFCRLLRYCLGEGKFGTEESQPLIRSSFPSGYVGAHVHINGVRWAVARPIGAGNRHYAATNLSAEDLLEAKSHENDYDEFRRTLNAACINTLPVREVPRTGKPIDWLHIVAWCARDQEARYQESWQWRSPRSGHDTPQFERPKIDGLFVMRLALGLYIEKEAKIERRLAELEAEQDRIRKDITEARREPEYWHTHRIRELKRLLGITDDLPLEVEGTLFEPSLAKSVAARQKKITEAIDELAAKIGELEAQEWLLRLKRRDVHRRLEQYSKMLEQHHSAANELRQAKEELEKDRADEPSSPDWQCPYSLRLVKQVECWSIYEQRQAEPSTMKIAQGAETQRVASQLEDRESHIATCRSETQSLTAQARGLREQYERLQDRRRKHSRKQLSLQSEADRLQETLDEAKKWADVLSGKASHARLDALHARLREAEATTASAKGELSDLLNRHTTNRRRITTLFDACIKDVLSEDYEGRVDLSEEDLRFRLLHGPPLGGEAINTLLILLADVSAILTRIEGIGHLPALLIHDSPREADLGRHIYWNFLRLLHNLARKPTGSERPPFQYILTTTTPPPPEMRDDQLVVLPLDASTPNTLLFQQVLVTSQSQLLQSRST